MDTSLPGNDPSQWKPDPLTTPILIIPKLELWLTGRFWFKTIANSKSKIKVQYLNSKLVCRNFSFHAKGSFVKILKTKWFDRRRLQWRYNHSKYFDESLLHLQRRDRRRKVVSQLEQKGYKTVQEVLYLRIDKFSTLFATYWHTLWEEQNSLFLTILLPADPKKLSSSLFPKAHFFFKKKKDNEVICSSEQYEMRWNETDLSIWNRKQAKGVWNEERIVRKSDIRPHFQVRFISEWDPIKSGPSIRRLDKL